MMMKTTTYNRNAEQGMKRRKNMTGPRSFIAATAALMLLIFCGVGLAKIPEPYVTYIGYAKNNGTNLTTGTVSLTVNDDTTSIVSYSLGSNADAGGKFILIVPMDSLDPRAQHTARTGDAGLIYIDGLLVAKVTLPERGTVVHMDLEKIGSAVPDTAITSKPASLTNVNTADFGFTSASTGATFQCSLDSAAYSSCTSPHSYAGLLDGSYTFNVRAVNSVGLSDPTPATYAWVIDTVAPASVLVLPPAVIGTSYAMSGTATDAGSGVTLVEISINSGPWTAVMGTGPWSYNWSIPSAGTYTVQSRATDAAGNVESPSSAKSVIVETRGIVGRKLQVDGIDFTIKGVQYRPVPIGSDISLPPYGDYFTSSSHGIYDRDLALLRAANVNTLIVEGWDATADHTDFLDKAFNAGVNPIYVIPGFNIAGGQDIRKSSSTNVRASIKADFVTSVRNHKAHPAILMWSVGNGLNAPSMYGNAYADLFSLIGELKDAAHAEEGVMYHPVATRLYDNDLVNIVTNFDGYVDVWAIDAFRGNSFGTLFGDYKVASTRPLYISGFNIDAYDKVLGAENETQQAQYAANLWAEITANSDTCTGGVLKEYSDQWWIGRTSADSTCTDAGAMAHGLCGAVSGISPDGYDNYEWWGMVRPVDNATSPDIMQPRTVMDFLKGTVLPDTTLPDGSLLINNGDTYATSPAVTLTLNCSDTGGSGCSKMQLSTDGTNWGAVQKYQTTAPMLLTAGDGVNTVYVRYIDNANYMSGAFSDTIILDTVSPETTITSGPTQPGSQIKDAYFTFVSEADAVFECKLNYSQFAACSSPATYLKLPVGAYKFFVRAMDPAGNYDPAPAEYDWNVVTDTTPPSSTFTISSPMNGSTIMSNVVKLSGTASDNASLVSKVEVSVNGVDWYVVNGTDHWTYDFPVPADGTYTFRSRATDDAGNVETPGPGASVTVFSRARSTVTVSGSQLLLNGKPFTVKGVVYEPTPIGEDPELSPNHGDYFTNNFSGIYNRDLPLLRQMNANTVRLMDWYSEASHMDFMDKAYNGGLYPVYIIAGYWINPEEDIDPLSPVNQRAALVADFRRMVVLHKDHPAVLMWSIGSDLNAADMYGGTPDNLFSLINEMAEAAHTEEGANYHPVTTALADEDLIGTIAKYDALVPAVDVWGVNVYRGASFGPLFTDYQAVSARPLLILEYGIDAYNNIMKAEYEKAGMPYQALYAESLWGEIMANAGVCSGGAIMGYTDQRWKGKYSTDNTCPHDVDAVFQGVCGEVDGTPPDKYDNYEWWGLMRSADNGLNPDVLTKRSVFSSVQNNYWTEENAIKINGNAEFTKTAKVNLVFSAKTNITRMCVSNTSTCSSWMTYNTSTSWILSAGDGVKTVYVWFKDAAGKVNAMPYSDTIKLDTSAPAGGTLTAAPADKQLTINWNGFTDYSGVASYKLIFSTTATPASCSTGTVLGIFNPAVSSFVHTGLKNMTKYYYRLCSTDILGNVSTGITVIGIPKPEITPPSGSVTINGGTFYTNSTAVTLGIAANDPSGVSKMCISNTSTCTTWTSYATTKPWSLTIGDGLKTVYVWFKDIWDNSSPVPVTSAITLDKKGPASGQLTATRVFDTVTLNWSGFSDAGSGLGGYKLMYMAGTVPSASCTTGTQLGLFDPSVNTFTHTVASGAATNNYRLCPLDRVGNISAGVTAAAKPLPEAVPPVGTVVINKGAVYTNSTTVTLTLNATDPAGVTQMCISNTGTCSTWGPYAATKTWTLAAGDGVKTVNVWYKDSLGNASAAACFDTITLDKTVPVNGAVTAVPGAGQASLNWAGFSDAGSGIGGYKVNFSTAGQLSSCASGTQAAILDAASEGFTHRNLTSGKKYYYRVCAVDVTGNMSSGVSASATPQ